MKDNEENSFARIDTLQTYREFPKPGIRRKYIKAVTQPNYSPEESRLATPDLAKTTRESIRRFFQDLPGTIEDEMPPVSQAFADKVKAMGGIMTPYGLICDPTVPVAGKRYMRLAKAFFCLLYNQGDRHVEDVEFRIRNYGKRNKSSPDWEGMNAHFARGLELAVKHRHQPGLRPPVYANKE